MMEAMLEALALIGADVREKYEEPGNHLLPKQLQRTLLLKMRLGVRYDKKGWMIWG